MTTRKLKRLKAAGWKVGSTRAFLELTDEEAALVEVKIALIDALRKSRQKRGLSQTELAQRMGSSQSRIAKLEAGDSSVPLDLIVRALIAVGTTRQEIQKLITSKVAA